MVIFNPARLEFGEKQSLPYSRIVILAATRTTGMVPAVHNSARLEHAHYEWD